jgi:hypothetical protein
VGGGGIFAPIRARELQAEYLIDEIVAQRLAEHLERAGFVIMKKPPATGSAALGRRFENAGPSRPGLAALRNVISRSPA